MKKKTIILVVEDEAMIRMEAVYILEEAGFTVAEASNADDAIKTLQRRNDIGAAFTDINMLGTLDGPRMAHAI